MVLDYWQVFIFYFMLLAGVFCCLLPADFSYVAYSQEVLLPVGDKIRGIEMPTTLLSPRPLHIKPLQYFPSKVETSEIKPRLVDGRLQPNHPLLFVIHETAVSSQQALRMLKHPNYRASYHAMIERDGSILLIVPKALTAFAAGRSRFNLEVDARVKRDSEFEPWTVRYNPKTDEAILNKRGVPSVNHFGYQVELVSPPDGYWCLDSPPNANPLNCVHHKPGQGKTHSGYTLKQYQSLAWLAIQLDIDKNRITTHKAVELARYKSHTDPRSFSWTTFWDQYSALIGK